MFEHGFVDEVRALMARGALTDDLPAMRAVGYRQVWQYLRGDFDLDTAFEKALIATRQLAKRQMTWLRAWPELCWLDTNASTDQQLKTVIRVLGNAISD